MIKPGLAPGCVEQCRGCAHRGFTEQQSLDQKKFFIEQKLSAVWSESVSVYPPLPSSRIKYRKKVLLASQYTPGEMEFWKIGMKVKKWDGKKQTDQILEIPNCPIHAEGVNFLIHQVRTSFPRSLPLVYVSQMGNLLGLVLKSPESAKIFDEIKSWAQGLDLSQLPDLGIFLNWNPSAGDRVFAAKGWRWIYGAKQGSLKFFEKEYYYGPGAFLQVQVPLYQKALKTAEQFLFEQIPSDFGVIDLYSGIGISCDLWQNSISRVIGVELSQESIYWAKKNGIHNLLHGRCEQRLPQIKNFMGSGQSHGIFCNPPRLGLEPEIVNWMIQDRAQISKIAYLSCSPGTLGRDLEKLVSGGYRVKSVNAYDFFPQTPHVETLALLTTS